MRHAPTAIMLALIAMAALVPCASGEVPTDGEDRFGPESEYDPECSGCASGLHFYMYSVWGNDEDGELCMLWSGGYFCPEHYEYVIVQEITQTRNGQELLSLTDSEGNVYEKGDYTFIDDDGSEYSFYGIAIKLRYGEGLKLYSYYDYGDDNTLVYVGIGAAAVIVAVAAIAIYIWRRKE